MKQKENTPIEENKDLVPEEAQPQEAPVEEPKEEKPEEVQPQEAPAEEPKEEKPEETPVEENAPVVAKKRKKMSNNGLRWLYFGLVGLFLVLAGYVVGSHQSIDCFGLSFNTTTAQSFIDFYSNITSATIATIAPHFLVSALVIAWGVISIIFVVRYIKLIVRFISLAAGGCAKRKRVEKKFRKAEKDFVKIIGMYFVFDLILVSCGAAVSAVFVFEACLLITFFLANTCLTRWRECYNSEEGFRAKTYLASIAPAAGYLFAAILAVVIFVSPVLSRSLDLFLAFGNFQSPTQNQIIWAAISFAGIGTWLAALLVGGNFAAKVAVFYPQNDIKASTKPGAIERSVLGKAIAVLIIVFIANYCFYFAGNFGTAWLANGMLDVFTGGGILAISLLALAICMRVSYNNANPKKSEEDDEDDEEEAERKKKKKAKKAKEEDDEDDE